MKELRELLAKETRSKKMENNATPGGSLPSRDSHHRIAALSIPVRLEVHRLR